MVKVAAPLAGGCRRVQPSSELSSAISSRERALLHYPQCDAKGFINAAFLPHREKFSHIGSLIPARR